MLDGEPERGHALLSESHGALVGLTGPENLQTRGVEAERAFASVNAGHWNEARQRIGSILGWLLANGRMARDLRVASAYVDAWLEPTSAHLSFFIDLAREDSSPTDWDRWMIEDWMSWARAQSAAMQVKNTSG
ncbi:MAG: hypothetical protein ABIO49_16680 [Dokdonella sp.]